eukprot:209085-Rhodomonas_salina.2
MNSKESSTICPAWYAMPGADQFVVPGSGPSCMLSHEGFHLSPLRDSFSSSGSRSPPLFPGPTFQCTRYAMPDTE